MKEVFSRAENLHILETGELLPITVKGLPLIMFLDPDQKVK
jgi:hypothetical protein